MDDGILRVWREQARELGVPDGAADEWLRLARPVLMLHKVAGDPAVGGGPIVGYLGGHPSVPLDIVWSGEPAFVASIDCASLPRDLPGFPLPRDGHLLFFVGDKWVGYESAYPDGDGLVLYIPPGTATSERVIPTDRDPGVESGRVPLQCYSCWVPPHCEGVPPPESVDPRMFDELMTVLEDPTPAYARGLRAEIRLGGFCFSELAGGDPCDDAGYNDPEFKKWRLLAHVERDLSMQGHALPFWVNWVICEDDLAGQRFDRVKTYIEDRFA